MGEAGEDESELGEHEALYLNIGKCVRNSNIIFIITILTTSYKLTASLENRILFQPLDNLWKKMHNFPT